MVAPGATPARDDGLDRTAPSHTRQLHGSRIVVGVGSLALAGDLVRAVPALTRIRFAIITDDTVGPLYAAALATALGDDRVPTLVVPAGEANKTRLQWARLTDELLDAGLGRDTAILALGGGVVGDLAGFVAATFMRGVPVVQVPTTLLAMIDASIGGKTGVDTRAGKNLVGAFHHPALVLADPAVLRTLPVPHLRAGLAEAVKHGVIASPRLLEWIATNAARFTQPGVLSSAEGQELVRLNTEIKANVVERDEREGGLRKILNFGHTIGHAVEHLSDYALLHGECVAIGMVAESRIAERLGVAATGTAESIERVLSSLGLPLRPPADLTPTAILEATRTDKKARGGRVEYALPSAIGAMAGSESGYGVPVPDAVALEVLGGS